MPPETVYDLLTIDWSAFAADTVRMIAAFALALPVAYDREKANQIMGLRTFPIVAIASCAFVIVGTSFIDASSPDAAARIIQGVMTGIGFLGGGAILKEGDRVLGSATAASIWATGAIGALCAYGRFDVAVLLSLAIFLVLRLLTPAKEAIDSAETPETERAS